MGVAGLRRWAWQVWDAVLPPAMAVFLLGLVQDSSTSSGPVRSFGAVVAVGQGLALYWRGSRPRTVMLITAAGGLVVQWVAPNGLLPYAGMVAIWALAVRQPPWASLPGLAALLGVTALSWPTAPPGDTSFALAVVVVVWALAEATRSRRAAIEQAARRAAVQEQSRLARELHDVIAHSVSVIVVQAAAADDVFEQNPAAARTALRSIESAGREALAELRRLLAAVGPVEAGSQAGLDRRPQPGLDRLAELAEPLRAGGLLVDIRCPDDEIAAVPPGVGLSAYRIVQEALTNTVRHARATRVEVRVRAVGGMVDVLVTDDGRAADPMSGPAPPREIPGRGLAGMRERAALLGGTLEAGARPDEQGFQVRARLPIRVPR
jgi:signal transduction histidine kinase